MAGIVAWVALLFFLTLLGAIPFFVEGESAYDVEDPTPLILAGIILTAYAPSLAAMAVAAFAPAGSKLGALLRKLASWRAGLHWYALVLVAPLVFVLAANSIYVFILGGTAPEPWIAPPTSLAFLGPLIAGSLGEELGWRGFAQPRLQERIGALWASIFIGAVWATWHLWPAITPGGASHLTADNLTQTYVRLIATAILYAWLYNSTKSLVLVMVAHAGHNIAIDTVQIPAQGAEIVPLLIAAFYLAAAIAVVCVTRPRTLAHAPVA